MFVVPNRSYRACISSSSALSLGYITSGDCLTPSLRFDAYSEASVFTHPCCTHWELYHQCRSKECSPRFASRVMMSANPCRWFLRPVDSAHLAKFQYNVQYSFLTIVWYKHSLTIYTLLLHSIDLQAHHPGLPESLLSALLVVRRRASSYKIAYGRW